MGFFCFFSVSKLVFFWGWVGGGGLFFGFIYLHVFISWYQKVVLWGYFSAIHKEKNDPKVINSTKRWIIFLLRILTRGQIPT
jgi:hypothetical protein